MKSTLLTLTALGILTACSSQTSTEKVQAQTSKVYALTAEERQAALINAKNYFGKEWINAGNQRGQLNFCKPSDSNFNGLVTCNGFVPQPNGTYKETSMYCGYRPELTGCSNEDTVK